MIGDILNAVSQFALGTANLVYNGVASNRARQDQLMMYRNSLPAQQMALRRAAGLNPYGDIGQIGANVPTPVNTAGSLDSSFQQMGEGLSRAMQYKFQRIANQISFLQLENEKTRLQIERDALNQNKPLVDANARNANANASYRELENWIVEQTKQNRVDLSDYEVKQAAELLFSQMIKNTYDPQIFSQTVNKIIEDIRASKSNTSVNERNAAVNEAKKDIDVLEEKRNEKRFTYEIKQLQWDKASIEAAENLIDSIINDTKLSSKSKATLIALLRAGMSAANIDH